MGNKKKVSVIIPCYNAEEYLETCMQSLLEQTMGREEMELIFVNDASTDGTGNLLMRYEERYPDTIMVIHLPINSKQGTARNIGMDYASGDYIGFCDADDWVEPDMYKLLVERLEETEADYAVCCRYEEYPNGTVGVLGPGQDGVLHLEKEEFKYYLRNQLAPAGEFQKLYRADFLKRYQLRFAEGLKYEDNFFSGISLYYVDKIGLVAKPLYHYRIHAASTVQLANAMHHLDRLTVEEMKLKELKERGLYEAYREDIEAAFMELYFVNTIGLLVNRFDELPEGVLWRMQDTVHKYFPNWRENLLIRYYKNEQFIRICELADYDFQTGNKQELIEALKQ